MSIGGSSLPAVRVDLNPDAMSQYGLSLDSVRTAIAAVNSNGPKGRRRERTTSTGRWTPTTSCARPASTSRW